MNSRGTNNTAGFLFISPWLLGFFVFTIYPIFSSLYLSMTSYDLLSAPQWIGLDNYIRMFTKDPKFWTAVRVTFTFVLVSVPLRVAFALAVAILLNRKIPGLSVYRVLIYLPTLIGGSVGAAVVWKSIFGSDGVVMNVLAAFGLTLRYSPIGNPDTALGVLMLLHIWQFGSSMLIFLAGLKAIPNTYYEAAIVDGAGWAWKFRKVTLPLLSPVIFFNLVMQTIAGFRSFTQSYVITAGGPVDRTLLYALHLYRRSFEYYEMGYGSALAWFLLVIIAVLTAIVFKSSPHWVYYETKGPTR